MWTQDKSYLTFEAEKLTPGVKLETTNHWIFQIAAWLLFIVTLGQKKVADTTESTAMAIGNTIYFPDYWSSALVIGFLPHECRHIYHCKKLGCGYAHIGAPIYYLLYFLFPIPIGLALGRAWCEGDCWAQQVKAHQIGKEAAIEKGAKRLASLSYLFALPEFIARPFLKWKFRNL